MHEMGFGADVVRGPPKKRAEGNPMPVQWVATALRDIIQLGPMDRATATLDSEGLPATQDPELQLRNPELQLRNPELQL